LSRCNDLFCERDRLNHDSSFQLEKELKFG
jgi:hypothetical protein